MLRGLWSGRACAWKPNFFFFSPDAAVQARQDTVWICRPFESQCILFFFVPQIAVAKQKSSTFWRHLRSLSDDFNALKTSFSICGNAFYRAEFSRVQWPCTKSSLEQFSWYTTSKHNVYFSLWFSVMVQFPMANAVISHGRMLSAIHRSQFPEEKWAVTFFSFAVLCLIFLGLTHGPNLVVKMQNERLFFQVHKGTFRYRPQGSKKLNLRSYHPSGKHLHTLTFFFLVYLLWPAEREHGLQDPAKKIQTCS